MMPYGCTARGARRLFDPRPVFLPAGSEPRRETGLKRALSSGGLAASGLSDDPQTLPFPTCIRDIGKQPGKKAAGMNSDDSGTVPLKIGSGDFKPSTNKMGVIFAYSLLSSTFTFLIKIKGKQSQGQHKKNQA